MELAATQQRAFYRYDLALPVTFSWKHEGLAVDAVGVTRDLAAHGIFINANRQPPLSAVVRCQLLFPPLDNSAKEPYLLGIAVGRVKRVEEDGFAVQTRLFYLRNTNMSPTAQAQ
ncbi:MAG: PilZ domain-containing protein [Terriglobales bacterium]